MTTYSGTIYRSAATKRPRFYRGERRASRRQMSRVVWLDDLTVATTVPLAVS